MTKRLLSFMTFHKQGGPPFAAEEQSPASCFLLREATAGHCECSRETVFILWGGAEHSRESTFDRRICRDDHVRRGKGI
jgi:hypothetical protein